MLVAPSCLLESKIEHTNFITQLVSYTARDTVGNRWLAMAMATMASSCFYWMGDPYRWVTSDRKWEILVFHVALAQSI